LALTWQNLLNNNQSYNKIIDSLKNLLYISKDSYICIEEEIEKQKNSMEIELNNVKNLEQ
jgi:hypothetical protein